MKKYLPVIKHIVAIALIFVCCGIFSVTFYNSKVKEMDEDVLTFSINDRYDDVTPSLRKSIVQDFYSDENIQAVRLVFVNKDAKGSGKVIIKDKNSGQIVSQGTIDLSAIAHGERTTINLDTPVIPKEKTLYTLQFVVDNIASGDIFLYKSRDEVYPYAKLYYDYTEQTGTLALQIVTDYAHGFASAFFTKLTVALWVILAATYAMCFIFKTQLHITSALMVLMFGTIYCFILPVSTAPDEDVHINTAYGYSNVLMGQDFHIDNKTMLVRQCDAKKPYGPEDLSLFSYKYISDRMNVAVSEEDLQPTVINKRTAEMLPFFLYLPPTLAITAARLLKLNEMWLLLAGRMSNVLFMALCTFFAVKLAPFGKGIFAVIPLLPMTLHLAASYSYDSIIIALSLVFVSLVLYYNKREKLINIWDMVALAALCILIAPSKAVYIFLCGFVVIVKKDKFVCAKQSYIAKGVLLAVSSVSFAFCNLKDALMYIIPKAAPLSVISVQGAAGVQGVQSVQPIENLYFSMSYILEHKRDFISLILNTVMEKSQFYLETMVGSRLSEMIITTVAISPIIIYCFIIS